MIDYVILKIVVIKDMKKMKSIIKSNLKWIIALISLVLFMIIIKNIYQQDIASFDNFYYHHISKLISNRMTPFIKIITNLSSAYVLIIITVLFLLLFKNKRPGILVLINLVTIFLFNLILKLIVARPRPSDINLIEELGYSFPSAHAMISTAFYGFIAYLICKTNLNKSLKILYTVLLAITIILIGISRIYLGVHFASDVFGGILIAISYLILYTNIVEKIKKGPKS